MLYFLIDNTTLSVYNDKDNKQSLSLVSKVKLHISLSKILNNSKKLNSVIARSLDEISEKVSLTNKRVSVIIDDNLLSHSVIINSKKYDSVDSQLKKEAHLKWGDAEKNLYFISEEKKSPKNIYHSVAIHHFLREKIKLNFNNFGMNIYYLVPLSSILTTGLKSSQYATIKNGKKFTFFGNTKKGFMFFKANFSNSKKRFEKIIGLLDIPKIQHKELDKNSLKFIFFNKLKIVEYLDNFIIKNIPLLNFVESNNIQIVSGESKPTIKIFTPLKNKFDYRNSVKNIFSGLVSILFLLLIISFFYDYKFLNINNKGDIKNIKEVQRTLSKREIAFKNSFVILENLENVLKKNNELKNLTISEDSFVVDNEEVELDNNSFTLVGSRESGSYNELLINFFEYDSNLKFKVFDSVFDKKSSKNIVFRFDEIESIFDIINEVKSFNNIFVKKVSIDKVKKSFHLYVTLIES